MQIADHTKPIGAETQANMERCFDTLQEAAKKDAAAVWEDASYSALLRMLKQYYEGGQWLHDYELDELGLLPQSLKRGVLAQDAVYDFLDLIKRNCLRE